MGEGGRETEKGTGGRKPISGVQDPLAGRFQYKQKLRGLRAGKDRDGLRGSRAEELVRQVEPECESFVS